MNEDLNQAQELYRNTRTSLLLYILARLGSMFHDRWHSVSCSYQETRQLHFLTYWLGISFLTRTLLCLVVLFG